MRRVTKENLIAQIDRLRKVKDEQGQLSMNGEYTLQAYEMLLATMEAEPVGEVIERPCSGEMNTGMTYRRVKGLGEMESMPVGTKFYTAQPAPVVPEEVLKSLDLLFHRSYFKRWVKDPQGYVSGSIPVRDLVNVVLFADTCRAAMLNQK